MIEKMKTPSDLEDGMLTKMFRKVLFDTGIINNIRRYMNRYVRKGGKRTKSQITKLILENGMSWKSFTFLIYEVLGVVRMDITLKLYHQNGEVTEHTSRFDSPEYAKHKAEQEKLKKELNDKKVKGKE